MKTAKRIISLAAVLFLLAFAFNIGSLRDSVSSAASSLSRRIGLASKPELMSADEVMADMLKQIKDYRTTLVFYNSDADTVVDAFGTVLDSHPEFFWLEGGCAYTNCTDDEGNRCIKVKLTFAFDEADVPSMDAEFCQVVDDIVARVPDSDTDYDKALFAHDYIIENCSYDHSLSDLISLGSTDFDRTGTTAYGCLVGRGAVCAGYTAAYQLLMNRLGVSCGCTEGSADNGEEIQNHIWNYITLEGENYYVDVTWDDLTYDDQSASAERLSHRYFCVTGDELYRSHQLDSGEADPNCVATKYNYHIYNGYYLSSYDYSAVSSLIDSQFGNVVMELKFASYDQLLLACSDLFDNNSVFSIPSIRDSGQRRIWHSACEDSCVLTLWFE
ncbi:MAG: hypothetical protein Q4A83_03660 [Bacillota bacterium]|nr:hypothetical protein [Bacillota bacterium]